MNERVRLNENGVPPDPRAPAQQPYYYFPPGAYPHGAPGQQPIPQGYQQPAYQQPAYQQPAPHQPMAMPQAPQPPYAQPEPSSFVTLDDAVAQIAARQRALEADPTQQRPQVPQPPLPPMNYGPEAYAPPYYRAPGFAPPPPYYMQAYPEAPRYASPPPPLAPAAPATDLSGLESQLRNLTAQIETLRQPAPDFSGLLRELREDLAEIGTRLNEAMPRHAVEALEAEVRRLAERIDISRAAGVDPDAIAGMERSLGELRDAIRSLKPAESLAGFEQAIHNLTERIDHASGAYQDPASLQQLENSIVALRGIVANVASNDTLQGLAEEVRGLSARVERVVSTSRGIDPDMLQTLEQRIGSLPVLGAIERGFADLKARLDSIPLAPQQPVLDPPPAVDFLKRDLVRTQDSLEAVHSTLGHLVDRLAMIEGGIREARIASETPAATFAPNAMNPGPLHHGGMSENAMPLSPPVADLSQFMQAAAQISQPAPIHPAMPAASLPETVTLPFAAQSHSPVADIRPADGTPAAATAEAAQAAKPKAALPPMRERQPIDSKLPHDFPLEPGTGTPRARPGSSAAERIAASEAALGTAKPGGANHPGQTNFIAAARRAAQAAAAAAPEAPKTSKAAPAAVAALAAAETGEEKPAKSIGQRMRSLFVGASAFIIVVAGGKLVYDMMFDKGHSTASAPAPVFSDPIEEPKPQSANPPAGAPVAASAPASPVPAAAAPAAPAPAAAPVLPQVQPSHFNAAPPSGVMIPERPKPQSPQAGLPNDLDSTGSIGKRSVAPSDARDLPTLPEKLPAALRAAAIKGQPAAQYEVGTRLIDGKSVPQNAEDGIRWLDRAAKAGIAPASFRLGGIYEKGLGVKKDLSVARRYYIAAAEKGHAKAMHNLAVLHAEGLDGKPDYKQAAEWFRRAADYGIADSQFNLAILFARGIGVEQNLAESYRWFALAALQGDRDAAKKRDDVGSKLDPATLAQARAAVQSFSAQPQPDEALTVQTPPGGWDKPAAENAPAKKPRPSVAKLTAS